MATANKFIVLQTEIPEQQRSCRNVIEVHISNIYAREEYRHVSLTGKNCKGVLTGFGLYGYKLAVESFLA